MATHSSPLASKIPWTEKPGGLQSLQAGENVPMPRRASSCQEAFLHLVSCLFPLCFSSFSSFGSSQACAFYPTWLLDLWEGGWLGAWGLVSSSPQAGLQLPSTPPEKLRVSSWTP